MRRITAFLWFDTQAEEAASFYASVFGDSRILKITRYGPGARERHDRRVPDDPDPAGAQRVIHAMLGMKKIDIAGLQRACGGS